MISSKKEFPQQSGVYLFKTRQGKVLYIGKAKNLKKRIKQYFQKKNQPVINTLLKESHTIETILTDDESDALHLEYNLIHSYNPAFNIRLKDDKHFPYIEITIGEDFPGIAYTRQMNPKNITIGPVADAKKTKIIIDLITRLFKLRTCSDQTFNKKTACLYYYIDRCSAPCIQKISKAQYHQDTRDAIGFLKGKKTAIIKRMKQKMKKSSDALQFEKAQQIKEDIQLIKDFVLESYISSPRRVDYDVIALHHRGHDALILLFSVLQGKVKYREIFSFSSVSAHEKEILKDFLVSRYKTHNLPGEILVPFLPSESRELQHLFSTIAKKKILIKVPLKGSKKSLLNLAVKNLNHRVEKNEYHMIAARLKTALNLNRTPDYIEGFDISHMSERERVGAAVVFKLGEPIRSLYRNYLIKKAGAGDLEALREVLERRFRNKKTNPDLLLIDGGITQLNMAKKVKQQLGLTSDIVSIAKREERIFLERGGSLLLPEDSPEKYLFQNIRDEVHRRAILHHRKRREKIPSKPWSTK
ncbi:MAG: excinuclease ABC subunit UvrC [Candidatus Aminicenantes bacterium]|nr:excinuclease ABC subunit UvrC [Candidatus Aminicenantes bacterium]